VTKPERGSGMVSTDVRRTADLGSDIRVGCPGRGICVMDGDGGLDRGSVIIEIHLELDLGLEPRI
jgi:hypothetical protein